MRWNDSTAKVKIHIYQQIVIRIVVYMCVAGFDIDIYSKACCYLSPFKNELVCIRASIILSSMRYQSQTQ